MLTRFLLIYLLLFCSRISGADLGHVDKVDLPDLSLDDLGKIGLIGQYDGISTYQFKGQQNGSTIDLSHSDSVLTQVQDKYLLPQAKTDGRIHDSCRISDTIYFAGNFSKVDDTESPYIASINAKSGELRSLDSKLSFDNDTQGVVNTIYCDTTNNTLYVGGDFVFNKSHGVAVYNIDDKEWSTPVFGGFKRSSKVNSIVKFNDNLVFAGKFRGLLNSSFTGGDNDTSKNVTDINKKQLVSFSGASVTAQGTDGSDDNADSLFCPTSDDDWYLSPNRQGTWRADFPYTFYPTRFRLYNAKDGSKGVKTFRFLGFPSNSILNLTYEDPESNDKKVCDAWCPLPSSNDQEYMDFEFVNHVGINSFQIDIMDYYGDQAGLAGIEIFQNDLVTFANDDLNKPMDCQDMGDSGSSSAKGDGWSQKEVQNTVYQTNEISDGGQMSDYSVVFEPNITVKANYSIQLYTPGCIGDGTCATRRGVNATVVFDDDEDPVSTNLFQSNDYDKYDTIYEGPVSSMKDGFRPRVILQPLADQQTPMTFVAEKVQFVYKAALNDTKDEDDKDDDDDDDDEDSDSKTSSKVVRINGLFEFSANNFSKIASKDKKDHYIPVGNSTVNKLGASLNKGAEIKSVVAIGDDQLLLGGEFEGDFGSNVALLKSGSDSLDSLPGKGLDGGVSKMLGLNSKAETVFLIGNFTGVNDTDSEDVKGLNHVVSYDTKKKKWQALGQGVDGDNVDSVALLTINGKDAVGFTGDFSNVLDSDNKKLSVQNGFGIYMTDDDKWVQESSSNSSFISGRLSASMDYDDTQFYFGSLRMLDAHSPSGAFMDSDFKLTPMPFELTDDSSSSSSNSSDIQKSAHLGQKKRDESQQQPLMSTDGNTINAGAFANKTTTVLGGHFKARGSDGETYENLLIVNDNQTIGLPENTIESDSIIYTVLVEDDVLYVGGKLSGKAKGGELNGLFFYDLKKAQMSSVQPPGVSGGEEIVTSIKKHPDEKQLVVMGSFDQVGSLDCSTLCVYDLDKSRWDSPNSGLSGLISSSTFIASNTIFLAGDLKLNDSSAYFAQYDFDSTSFEVPKDLNKGLPGPVNSFAVNGKGVESVYASGTDKDSGESYLRYWNDKKWTKIDDQFERGTNITDLKLMKMKKDHKSNDNMKKDEILLVSGSLVLKDFGNASTAIYDGKDWQPLFLTSEGDTSGSINALFSEQEQDFGTLMDEQHMARGFVVLISLAIAVGLVLLLVLLGLLVSYLRKRKQGYRPAPSRVSETDMTETVPPANLLEEMGHVGEASHAKQQ